MGGAGDGVRERAAPGEREGDDGKSIAAGCFPGLRFLRPGRSPGIAAVLGELDAPRAVCEARVP